MASKRKKRTALFDEPIPADDVVLRGLRFGSALMARLALFFAEHGLTLLQFNVLRILYVRDPDFDGMPIGSIGDRLTVRGPDVTRLVDRLVAAELVERFRSDEDRRVVRVRLTDAGFDLVEKIHTPLIEHNIELLRSIPKKDLEQLATLLGRAYEVVA